MLKYDGPTNTASFLSALDQQIFVKNFRELVVDFVDRKKGARSHALESWSH